MYMGVLAELLHRLYDEGFGFFLHYLSWMMCVDDRTDVFTFSGSFVLYVS